MFRVRFEGSGCDEAGELLGLIEAPGLKETFSSPTEFWDRAKYENQWIDAMESVLGGCEASALVTEVHDPPTANFIVWWPLYCHGNVIKLRQQILFMDQVEQEIDLNDLPQLGARVSDCQRRW